VTIGVGRRVGASQKLDQRGEEELPALVAIAQLKLAQRSLAGFDNFKNDQFSFNSPRCGAVDWRGR